MPRTSRVFPFALLLPLSILFLLPILFLQSMPSEAAPAMGITPTATSRVTSTPTRPPSRPTPSQPGVADPVIVKRGEPSEALPGEEVTFTLEVTNQGEEAAVDVVLVTPEDVERYRNCPYLVICPALQEGKVVYDTQAPAARRSSRMAQPGPGQSGSRRGLHSRRIF